MKLPQSQVMRLAVLAVVVVLEGVALLSAILHVQLVPGNLYPRVVSVAVLVLPSAVGLLARRLEAALLLAVLPFWILGVVYLALFSPVWYMDLFDLGLLVERVASTSVLLFGLALLGWLLQRVLRGNTISAVQSR